MSFDLWVKGSPSPGEQAMGATAICIVGYDDDKKLITFSDSVQDAAHRAGFFAARSYQFTLRSALQQALMAYGVMKYK